MGQTDSSYVGQEVKISDPVWQIISLADKNNIASPLAFVCGAWRPKADYLGGVGGGEAPPRTSPGVWGAAAPQLNSVYISLSGLVGQEIG